MENEGGLTGAPDSAEEGVNQEDAGPPVAPEGGEGKVVGAVLGPQEQHRHYEGVHIDDEVVVQLVRPEVTASISTPGWLRLHLYIRLFVYIIRHHSLAVRAAEDRR